MGANRSPYNQPSRYLAISRASTLHLAEMAIAHLHPLFAEELLVGVLSDTPVVPIHGPREPKATLAQGLGAERGYSYFSFDDDVTLYDGEATAGFGEGLFAVPVRRVWEVE